jgi:hypothetical protein
MALPNKSNLVTMDYSYLGQPFVEVPAKDSIVLTTMDYSYLGQPFVRNPAGAGAASIALTGTITTAVESDIVTGGKTIILTITGDTWVTAGATFDAQRQNIINGLDSAQSEAGGWDAVVKATMAVTAVVRTSDTVVTITLPAFATYAITANETITATVPSTALTGATQIVASPTFTITNQQQTGNFNFFLFFS